MSALPTFVDFYQFRQPFEKRFCKNIAITITASDGINSCNVQSFVSLFCGIALALSWAMQSIQIYLAIVLRIPNKQKYDQISYVCTLLPPLAIAIAIFSLKKEGYTRGNINCFASQGGNGDIYYFFIPVFIIGCIGSLLMVVVIYKAVRWMHISNEAVVPIHSSLTMDEMEAGTGDDFVIGDSISSPPRESMRRRNRDNSPPPPVHKSLLDTFRAIVVPVRFVVLFIFCLCGLVCGRAEIWDKQAARNLYFDEWITCVFDNYVEPVQFSWVPVCGKQPNNDNISIPLTSWLAVAALGHSIFVTIALFRASKCVSLMSGENASALISSFFPQMSSTENQSFVEFDSTVDEDNRIVANKSYSVKSGTYTNYDDINNNLVSNSYVNLDNRVVVYDRPNEDEENQSL